MSTNYVMSLRKFKFCFRLAKSIKYSWWELLNHSRFNLRVTFKLPCIIFPANFSHIIHKPDTMANLSQHNVSFSNQNHVIIYFYSKQQQCCSILNFHHSSKHKIFQLICKASQGLFQHESIQLSILLQVYCETRLYCILQVLKLDKNARIFKRWLIRHYVTKTLHCQYFSCHNVGCFGKC